jgi:tetratricopeptide (TPR) repeat protein
MRGLSRGLRRCLSAFVLVWAVTGCGPGKATPGETKDEGKISITTSSTEAKQDYLRAKELAQNLRAFESQQLLQGVVARDPQFAMAYYRLALTAPTAKAFFEDLNKAVALADRVSEGERGMILGLQDGVNGDPTKQLEKYTALVTRYPRDEEAHVLLGNAYLGMQEYAKAVAEYQQAIAIAPNYAPTYNSLGYAYRPTGNLEEAEKAFKKYIELIPGDPNPYDSYAELLMKMGRFDESIAMYRKALAIDPGFSSSYVGVAADWAYLGRYDSALAETQKLQDRARTDGDRRTATFTNAFIEADQGRLDQALAELEKLYAMGEKINDTAAMAGDLGSIGDVLLEDGKPEGALKRYDQALQLVESSSLSSEVKDDNRLVQHFNLGRVALRRNDLATATGEAEAFMQGATAKHNDGEIRLAHQLAGMIALQLKQYDRALEELGQADQQNGYNLYRMGLAHLGKGDKAGAQDLFTRVAGLNILPSLDYAFVRTKARRQAGLK